VATFDPARHCLEIHSQCLRQIVGEITLVPTAEAWVYLISFTPPKCRDCYDCLYSPFSVVVTMDGVAVTATKLHREPAPPDCDVVSRSVSSVEISSKPSMSAMGMFTATTQTGPGLAWLSWDTASLRGNFRRSRQNQSDRVSLPHASIPGSAQTRQSTRAGPGWCAHPHRP
jgi:hypothetical protein